MNLADIMLYEHIIITPDLRMAEAVCTECKTVLCGLVKDQFHGGIFMLASLQDLQVTFIIDEPWLI